MSAPADLLTSCGPDGVWRIPPDAEELRADQFTATTTPPTLAELQGYVGGYVQVLDFRAGLAWLDEEGKLKGYPINPLATVLGHLTRGLDPSDVIVGPCMITIGRATPD